MGITISPLWYHCNDLAQLYNISALVQLLDKCYLPFPLNAIGLECLRVKSGESLVQVSWRFHSMNEHTETWGNGWVWRIKKCHHRQRRGGELSLILIISVSSGRFDGDLFDIYRKLESTTSPKIHHYSPVSVSPLHLQICAAYPKSF